ncbi:MAG: hypothetical protein ACHQCI_01745 [Solirubrobacterales bacterium]
MVAFLSWPSHVLTPGGDIDTAWQVALQMAAHRGLDFGTQFILNGGPLEFVLHPMVLFGGPAAVGAIYLLLTQVALGLTLVWALRRNLPVLLAAPLAYVLLTLDADQFVPAPEPILALVFIWAMVSLAPEPPPFARMLLLVGGGIAGAAALLVQFSDGFLIFCMCVIAVLAQPRERGKGIAIFSSVFLVSLAAFWFATGQGISNFDDYVRTAFEVLSEWSTALPYNAPAVSWARPYAAFVIGATFVATFLGTRGLPPLRRGAAFLIVAGLDFSAWKHGFVIETATYAALFTWLMMLPWLVFRWRGSALAVALGAIATLVVLFYPVSGHKPSELAHPIARARDGVEQLETLLLPGPRAEARSESREFLRGFYHLDPETLAMLRGRSVLSYPWETAPIWAYDLEWHPEPLFPYLAYSPYLDRRDAEAISSPSGPEAILRHSPCGATTSADSLGCEAWNAVGPTFLPHEEPEATIEMLCHFEPARTTPRLQVLYRVPNRCGQPRLLTKRSLEDLQDSRIPVPRRDEVIFARVHGLEPSGLERLRTFLYRATNRIEIFDGKYTYRVVPGTMEDGIVLRVPPKLNYQAPFPVTPNASSISFETNPGVGVSDPHYEIEYFAMPVRAPRAVPLGRFAAR